MNLNYIFAMRRYLPLLLLISTFFYSCTSSTEPDDSIASDIPLSTSDSVTDVNGNVYDVGYTETEDNLIHPVVRKFDANGELTWEIEHDNSTVDVRAEIVTLDSQSRPWIVFSLDGGSSSNSYITLRASSENAFNGVFQPNYGQGGGPRVSLIARLNPENGIMERGTFVTARLNNGNTNTLQIRGIGVADGFIRVQAESAFRPPHTGTSFVPHPEAGEFGPCGSFLVQIDFTELLGEIAESDLMTIQEASALPNTVWNADCSIK
jgi:hypothetical protein